MPDSPADRPEPAVPSRRTVLKHGAVAAAFLAPPAAHAVVHRDDEDSVSDDDTPPTDAITAATIAEAQKIADLSFTDAERTQMAQSIAPYARQWNTLRDRELPNGRPPASIFDPRRTAPSARVVPDGVRYAEDTIAPCPADDTEIAFASLAELQAWMTRGDLTSLRLTEIYLRRIERLDPTLRAVITPLPDAARAAAQRADAERAAGTVRSALHGIPWGAKDLFDTAGVRTTWGAMPYRDRVPDGDATVVRRLEDAGAVLIAKTSLGALAYGDQWFDARTRNPWNPQQGSSGSSAGSASGTVAGLFGFSLGTETYGSIVSPCMRCGACGLRPTFGRISRAGAMALGWTLDKVGPICRAAEDTMRVLEVLHGADPDDPAAVTQPLGYDATTDLSTLRIGVDAAWFERGAVDLDRAALQWLRDAGATIVPVTLPDAPYGALRLIVELESAAAHDELTRSDRDDELVWQAPAAWPNTFRTMRLIPAVEYVQVERFRFEVAQIMRDVMADVDALFSPSFAANLLLITNMTGHPSMTVPIGFRSRQRPHGITVWGHLDDEGTIVRIARELERRAGVRDQHPEL